MKNNRLQPGDVYEVAIAELPAGDIDHHNSDLYIKRTAASQAIIARLENRALLNIFRDSEGVAWYELPFCYTPYWNNPSKHY